MLCKLLIKCLPAYHSNRCPDYSLRSTQQLGWSTPHASTSMALPILRDLHWLRIAERIDFKLSVLCFRCLHSMAPPYLADDLHRVAHIEARRRLRSASTAMLVVPRTRLSTIGDRTFPVVAPRIWNNLPQHVVSLSSLPTFKRHITIVLFSRSFPRQLNRFATLL